MGMEAVYPKQRLSLVDAHAKKYSTEGELNMKKEMKTKMTVDLDKAIAYIECLLDGLKSGTLVVEHDEGKMTLHPEKVVKLEIETEEKDGNQELEIEMKWGVEASVVSELPEILGRKFGPISD
jgi:amphi-Trp domain-containing protein